MLLLNFSIRIFELPAIYRNSRNIKMETLEEDEPLPHYTVDNLRVLGGLNTFLST